MGRFDCASRRSASCYPVRDYLDGCIIRTNGCFVAGYEAIGLNTFFHSDETRNRTKETLEALVRSLPERSMRMQVRYEVTEGHGDLTERYVKEQRIDNPVLQALDRERLRLWNSREEEGHYLRRRLHCTSSGIRMSTTTARTSNGGRRVAQAEQMEPLGEQMHPANASRTRGPSYRSLRV